MGDVRVSKNAAHMREGGGGGGVVVTTVARASQSGC